MHDTRGMSKQLRSNPGKITSPAREILTRACSTEPISLVRVGATTLAWWKTLL